MLQCYGDSILQIWTSGAGWRNHWILCNYWCLAVVYHRDIRIHSNLYQPDACGWILFEQNKYYCKDWMEAGQRAQQRENDKLSQVCAEPALEPVRSPKSWRFPSWSSKSSFTNRRPLSPCVPRLGHWQVWFSLRRAYNWVKMDKFKSADAKWRVHILFNIPVLIPARGISISCILLFSTIRRHSKYLKKVLIHF